MQQLSGRYFKGEPQNIFSEVFSNSATAHILECLISGSAEEGAVDSNHELFGYKGCMSAMLQWWPNLAVNPSNHYRFDGTLYRAFLNNPRWGLTTNRPLSIRL